MTNPSIPTPSQRYPIESPHSGLPRAYLKESEMTNPIRTDISVGDMNLLRMFLDANDMQSFELGYYEVKTEKLIQSAFQNVYVENWICYTNNQPTDLIDNNLIHMTLKYGGLVDAFKHFKKAIGRI